MTTEQSTLNNTENTLNKLTPEEELEFNSMVDDVVKSINEEATTNLES